MSNSRIFFDASPRFRRQRVLFEEMLPKVSAERSRIEFTTLTLLLEINRRRLDENLLVLTNSFQKHNCDVNFCTFLTFRSSPFSSSFQRW